MAGPAPVPFVDAHVHFWQLDRLRYPWLRPPFAADGPNGDVSAIAHDYLPADHRAALRDRHLAGVVHVEAGAYPADALAETDWLHDLAVAEALPIAIVAQAALDTADLDRHLAAQAARPRVRGIRHIVNWHPDPRRSYTPRDVTGDERWQRGFAMLADHGLSFDLQAYPPQLARLAPLIERHPAIPVFVNHAGMGIDGEAEWLDALRALARIPHVAIKLSGLGFAIRPWNDLAVRDRIRRAIDLFGPDRAMIGSDFPTDQLFATFERTLAAMDAATADLSQSERHALFAGTACRLYRLDLDLPSAHGAAA